MAEARETEARKAYAPIGSVATSGNSGNSGNNNSNNSNNNSNNSESGESNNNSNNSNNSSENTGPQIASVDFSESNNDSVTGRAANAIPITLMGYNPKRENTSVLPVPPELLRFTEPPPESQLAAVATPFDGEGSASRTRKPTAEKKPREIKPFVVTAKARDFKTRQNRVEQLFASDATYAAEKDTFRDKLAAEEAVNPDYPFSSFEAGQKTFEERGYDGAGQYSKDIEVYMPSTRKGFYKFINDTYADTFNLEAEVENRVPDPEACQKLMAGGRARVEPFLYQKFVKEYTRMSSPYRGMLVYHGLGSGKTCSSIAAAEALYGVANKRIIVMTPKSLQENFIKEISFCGFRHFSLNNHWVPVPLLNKARGEGMRRGKEKVVVTPNLIHEIYGRSVLSLSAEYISKIKYAPSNDDDLDTNAYLWLADFEAPPNYASLVPEQQDQIRKQIDESVRNRIEFISYNGVKSSVLKQWACEGDHFDNAVIVIDEIHNLGRLMQDRILPYLIERPGAKRTMKVEPITPDRWKPALCDNKYKNYTRGFLFYRLLVGAKNSKIIGLSGTPIINFPEELGILSNVLAGYMDCIEMAVPLKTPESTAAFKSLLESDPRIDFIRMDPGTSGQSLVLVSLFNEGYIKVLDETTNEFIGVKQTDEPEAQANVAAVFERIVAKAKALPTPIVITKKPTYKSFPRLPFDGDTFRKNFIDLAKMGIQERNEFVLKKRLSGIISYYKGSKSDYLPSTTDEVVECEFSPYAASVYIKQRLYELSKEPQNEVQDRAGNLYAAVEAYSKAANPSSYRFRSRAACNFAFPESIPRPYPTSVKSLNEEVQAVREVDLDENVDRTDAELAADVAAVAAAAAEERAVVADLRTQGFEALDNPTVEEVVAPLEGAAALAAAAAAANEEGGSVEGTVEGVTGAATKVALTDAQRVVMAMAKLNAERDLFLKLEGASEDSSLRTYSKKLHEMLTRIATSPGPVLVYSQYKTVEGLGVLAIALKANGWEEVSYTGKWWGDDPEFTPASIESLRKGPGINRFITFTGGGTAAQRNVTLKMFNGEFDTLPEKTKTLLAEGGFDLKKKYLHGELFKAIGITGAGAEGISLRNVRQVHIMESYWNSVRIEQVKGRAVRICSHMYLPPEERKVDIFTYVSKFSADMVAGRGREGGIPKGIEQSDGEIIPGSVPKRIAIYTSDEKIRNLSIRKEEVNTQLLTVLKETAVDCRANQPDNEPTLDCFTVAVSGTPYMFDPDLERDKASTQAVKGLKEKAPRGAAAAATAATAAPGAPRPKQTTTAIKIELERNGVPREYLLGVRDPSKNYVEFYETNDTALTRPIGKLEIDVDNTEETGDVDFY